MRPLSLDRRRLIARLGAMAVQLVVPVQALFGAAQPPPSVCRPAPPCHAPPAFMHAHPPAFIDHGCVDRLIARRAVAEAERLRNELGASDMALEAARSELHRERIESALDRRATVATADAAAARAAVHAESFSRPIDATLAARSDRHSGVAAGDGAGAPGSTPGPGSRLAALRLSSVAGAVVVHARSLIDLFA